MKEKLLQYIWQFQLFNKHDLTITNDEYLQVIYPGKYNENQGPDFLDGKIKIGKTTWVGNIELHVRSSDWNLHKHSSDKNYANIILHVVWVHDQKITDANGNELATFEINNRISKILLGKYNDLMNAYYFIPCEKQVYAINELNLTAWKTRLVAERLENKTALIFKFLKENNFHWEETLWWLIAKNFGTRVNGEFFEKLARSIPINILSKHRIHQHQLEAVLFGQTGLLSGNFTEEYPLMLQKEYTFFKNKYDLQEVPGQLFFLRMRPANFPTIRLAQLASLIQKSHHLFSKLISCRSVKEIKKLLNISVKGYWDYHFRFEEVGKYRKKNIGSQMINTLIINTIIPIVFAYGLFHDEQKYKDKAIEWLENLPGENNNITNGFKKLRYEIKNSFDSQAFIQLKNKYCDEKRCLECVVGRMILGSW
jgi:hypothetical protein